MILMTITKDFVLRNKILISNYYGQIGVALSNDTLKKYVVGLHPKNPPDFDTKRMAQRGHLIPRLTKQGKVWVLAQSNTPNDTRILVLLERADRIGIKPDGVKILSKMGYGHYGFDSLFLILRPQMEIDFTIEFGEKSYAFRKQNFQQILHEVR